MERQIKFRGLRTDGKGWVYGDLLQEYPHHNTGATIQQHGCLVYEVHRDSVGQFTGLKDKNGKEIYEGDVMKYGRSKFSVVFDPKYGYVAEFSKVNTNICIPIYKFEIIGTIHDGKEVKS